MYILSATHGPSSIGNYSADYTFAFDPITTRAPSPLLESRGPLPAIEIDTDYSVNNNNIFIIIT
jgi:hypothetical protein